jgi:8-oxo-dGTP pyrophosphatase MutT (NUDIX family)
MIEYVLGFMFAGDSNQDVVLIRKLRPNWMRGKLNGVGGHIEPFDQSPEDAMVREFYEETGISTNVGSWQYFGLMMDAGSHVQIYVSSLGRTGYKAATIIDKHNNTVDEQCHLFDTRRLDYSECVSNLEWLIPLAKQALANHALKVTVTQ